MRHKLSEAELRWDAEMLAQRILVCWCNVRLGRLDIAPTLHPHVDAVVVEVVESKREEGRDP